MGPTLCVVRVPGMREFPRSARGGRRGGARAKARPAGRALGQHKESLKETHQGLPAHALLALTPTHRTSPANKYSSTSRGYSHNRPGDEIGRVNAILSAPSKASPRCYRRPSWRCTCHVQASHRTRATCGDACRRAALTVMTHRNTAREGRGLAQGAASAITSEATSTRRCTRGSTRGSTKENASAHITTSASTSMSPIRSMRPRLSAWRRRHSAAAARRRPALRIVEDAHRSRGPCHFRRRPRRSHPRAPAPSSARAPSLFTSSVRSTHGPSGHRHRPRQPIRHATLCMGRPCLLRDSRSECVNGFPHHHTHRAYGSEQCVQHGEC